MKYLLSSFLIMLIGCGPCRHPKQIYCKDLPEGVVTDRTYYALGKWGHFDVSNDGTVYTTNIYSPTWFDLIRVGDTIVNKK